VSIRREAESLALVKTSDLAIASFGWEALELAQQGSVIGGAFMGRIKLNKSKKKENRLSHLPRKQVSNFIREEGVVLLVAAFAGCHSEIFFCQQEDCCTFEPQSVVAVICY
jgi:hypothetical protein